MPLQSAVEVSGVTWTIDGEVMVEFLPGDSGPGRLVVREIALLSSVKKQVRSRHVRIEYRPLRRVTMPTVASLVSGVG